LKFTQCLNFESVAIVSYIELSTGFNLTPAFLGAYMLFRISVRSDDFESVAIVSYIELSTGFNLISAFLGAYMLFRISVRSDDADL